jgi:hypothetical protein
VATLSEFDITIIGMESPNDVPIRRPEKTENTKGAGIDLLKKFKKISITFMLTPTLM